MHSPRALLSCYRWLNKVSNLKIHRWFCSHCLVTWLLRLRYITGHGSENNLWFSINRQGRFLLPPSGRGCKCWPVPSLPQSRQPKTAHISRWHRNCQLWFQARTVSSPRDVLLGLAPPNKAPTISISGVLIKLSERQLPRKAPNWWLSVDGCGPASCKFLTTKNRRLSNSDLGLSYLWI